MWTHRHTHTHTHRTTNPGQLTLAAHAHRGLITSNKSAHMPNLFYKPSPGCKDWCTFVYMILLGKTKNYVQNYRNACKPTQPTCTCTYILYIIDTCTLHTYCTLHTCIFHGWSNCPPPSPPAPRKALLTFSCCLLAVCEQTVLTSGWVSLPCFDHTSRALCR